MDVCESDNEWQQNENSGSEAMHHDAIANCYSLLYLFIVAVDIDDTRTKNKS